MSSNTLIEVFGHIVFSFTRGVTERYNPQEPEYTAESFGYDPLQNTGREWYYHPVDELIYQEYSDKEATSLDYLPSNHPDIRIINACSTEENEETQEHQQDEDRAMAWKRLRPSALRTVCTSMYIGALISLLTATITGSVYMLISYICNKTVNNCELHPKKFIPLNVQWMRSISTLISGSILHISSFVIMLFLFRPYQIMGVKTKLMLVSCFGYCLEAFYIIALQAMGISHSKPSSLQLMPTNVIFFISLCFQVYFLTNHFCIRQTRRSHVKFFFQMIVTFISLVILGAPVAKIIYPAYNKQGKDGKLVIALFSPLIGVLLKVISRVSVQRLYPKCIYPGYSYILLAPLYCCSAVLFRVLQADLGSLQSIAVLGIIHGAAEVMERSTMVVIDHICHVIWKRTSAPWGSFRTPRRERLMADIAIMSMLYESTAIVSVNGFLYLYQFMYLKNDLVLNLLQTFGIRTSVQLVIEWFFTSVSLAIATRYQNIAVMAVWRTRWKRHILTATIASSVLALWSTQHFLPIAHDRFNKFSNQTCKMPFT